nr:transcriptional regulator [Bradyrhizobium sediminis]
MIVYISNESVLVNRKSDDLKNITSAHIRAARALIRWTAEDLAREAVLGVATIRRAESADGPPQMTASNLAAIRRTLETAGIEFLFENEGGLGVRLRNAQRPVNGSKS